MQRLLLLVSLLLTSIVAKAQTLNIYNWSDYLPESVITQFKYATGIEINYITYESNEEMYDKIKAGGGEYDLVIPSTYYVSKMQKEGLLQLIDKGKLKNFNNLDPRLLNQQHDPNNEFSIPYLWGTTALFIDTSQLKTASPKSWSDLWRPEYKGKLILTDDMREVFHVALRVLGYSGNSTNPKEIEAAYNKLIALGPNVAEYNSEDPRDAIVEARAAAGMIWNGEAFQAHEDRFTVNYIYPAEGAILWMDSLVIPKGAKNVEAAYLFLDYLMRPGVAALVSENIGYATPNRKAYKYLSPWTRGSNIVYPNDAILKNAELQIDVGDALPIYEKYWQKLRGE